MNDIPQWLERVFKIKTLPERNPADLPSPEREDAAHQMLLMSEILGDKARLAEILRIAPALDPARLLELDAQLDHYRPAKERGIVTFWSRLVLLQQKLAKKGTRELRAATAERDIEVYTNFKIARRGDWRSGLPRLTYAQAIDAVAAHHKMTPDAVKKALDRIKNSPLFDAYDLGRMD